MRKYLLLTLAALFITFTTKGEDMITISGRVTSDKNKNLPQVNIRTVRGTIATVSNGDGVFSLKLPISLKSDSVKFSSIGYVNRNVSVEDMLSQQNDPKNELTIELESENVSIQSIGVDFNDATLFMQEVFSRRYENSLNERSSQEAFYREMIKKRESFATLTEAVINIDKTPYNSGRGSHAEIYKGRSLRDSRFTDTLFVKFQGGVTSALLLDVTKHSDLLFTEKPFVGCNYWFKNPAKLEGRSVMVVAFNQNGKDQNGVHYRGDIYVDSLTLGIARIEFDLNIDNEINPIDLFIKDSPRYVNIDVTAAKYISSYRFLDGVWLFDYCNMELDFVCHHKKRLFKNNYTIISEMVVTKRNPEAVKIPYSSTSKLSDFAYDSVQKFSDEDFWENYNIIAHERSINTVIKRFIRQLQDK